MKSLRFKVQSLKKKIKSRAAMTKITSTLRRKGKKVVFTNGCFDILHAGHIEYLAKAKKLGDILVVGLNSDRSVKKIKGRSRPINTEGNRAEVLAALYFVDYITIFGELTPESLIKNLKPDVLVKGGDWRREDIVGGDFVLARGGRLATIPFVKGHSTTSVIKKLGL